MSVDEKSKPGRFRKTWAQMEEEMVESMRVLKGQRGNERKHIVECKFPPHTVHPLY